MLINLTPHPVTVLMLDGPPITIPPSPSHSAARLSEETAGCHTIPYDGRHIPRFRIRHRDLDGGLPDSEPGVYYIVSRLVALALPERDDLLFPSQEVRAADGRIIGCRRLDSVASS